MEEKEPTEEQVKDFIEAGRYTVFSSIEDTFQDTDSPTYTAEMTPEMWEKFTEYFSDDFTNLVLRAHDWDNSLGTAIKDLTIAMRRVALADKLSRAGLPGLVADVVAWYLVPKFLLPKLEITVSADITVTEVEV